MKHTLLLVVAAAFVLTACGKSDTPKSPAPATGSTAGSTATPSAPVTPAPKMEEKKDEMKK